ncbi:hypothetical protein TWF970_010608 [Orbilia oligospora]|uniref:Uncharacterized protein n=1 Tax=Orbilia oligospora TaxID=2813651 RepID=A0A7C8RFZ1_ORBOL|nr:hypothetical protein TWF970_010608 [Orbilia oligospora]
MPNQEQPVSIPAPTYSSAPAMEMTPQSRTQQDSQREAEPKVQLGLRGGRDRGCLAGCLAALCICCACDACIDCVDDCCCC